MSSSKKNNAIETTKTKKRKLAKKITLHDLVKILIGLDKNHFLTVILSLFAPLAPLNLIFFSVRAFSRSINTIKL